MQPGAAAKGKGANAYKELPDFCRVAATLKPSSDSDIKIEVWLPVANWNRKLQAVGNGGWAGVISYSAMAEAVKAGYASVSTDTGHVGGSGSFALEHPERLIDFQLAFRTRDDAQGQGSDSGIYGSAPKLSYWNGCSTEAGKGSRKHRILDDFDGSSPAHREPTAISL